MYVIDCRNNSFEGVLFCHVANPKGTQLNLLSPSSLNVVSVILRVVQMIQLLII